MSVVAGSFSHIVLIAIVSPFISMQAVVGVTMITETVILGIKIYGVRKYHLWQVT